MEVHERLSAMHAERQRLALKQKTIIDTLRPGDRKDAATVSALATIDEGIQEMTDGIDQLVAREKREQEAAEAWMNDPVMRSMDAGRSTNRFGNDIRNAIAEVMDGRSTAIVEAPKNVQTESGAPGDGVPVEVRTPVSTMDAASVVLSLPGIRREAMASDRAIFPRLGSATVTGVAEAAQIGDAATVVDSITVTATKFACVETLSTELVEDMSAGALDVFGSNLLKHLARRVDLGLLEGDGALDLVGLRSVAGANSTSVAATPANFVKFRTAEYLLLEDDGDPTVWIGHPRSWNTLAGIKTGIASDESTLLEPSPQRSPRELLGYPVRLSSQITTTEGAGAGSWMALVDTSQLVVCERRPARIEVSRDARFSEDLIQIKASWRGGLAVLNAEAVSLLTDIRA